MLVLAFVFVALGFADASQKAGETLPMARSLGPLDVVESSVSLILEVAQSQPSEDRRAKTRRAAHDLFDFNAMARRSLGQQWKDLSPLGQAKFVELFTDTLRQFFVTIVERCSDANVVFVGEKLAGAYAQVHSRITQNPEVGISSIEYRLFQSGSRWAVYDIVLDGRSLVANYRSHFDAIDSTSSPVELLQRMRTEQLTRTQSRDAVGSGILLGAGLFGRWR